MSPADNPDDVAEALYARYSRLRVKADETCRFEDMLEAGRALGKFYAAFLPAPRVEHSHHSGQSK